MADAAQRAKTYQVILAGEPKTKNRLKLSSARKLAILLEQTQKSKNDLVNWLETRDLADQVEIFEDKSPFNMVMVHATEKAAKALKGSPLVKAMSSGRARRRSHAVSKYRGSASRPKAGVKLKATVVAESP